MDGLLYAIIALMAVVFGWMGFIAGNRSALNWEVGFAVMIALLIAIALPLVGEWSMFPIVAPWLIGVGIGRLLRK